MIPPLKLKPRFFSREYVQTATPSPPPGHMWLILGGGFEHTTGTISVLQIKTGENADQRLCYVAAAHATTGVPFPNMADDELNPSPQFWYLDETQRLVAESGDTSLNFKVVGWEFERP